jgi:hypothetical protein
LRRWILLALVFGALFLGGMLAAGGMARPPAPAHAAPAHAALIRASVPLTTATPIGGDPEYLILQYVVAHNPTWNCQGPSGPPGQRQITGCGPFGNPSHPTTGYVTNYGSPGAAQANWEARRAAAMSYPIFLAHPYAGYPGYDAGDTAYPYAHYESYFWGSVWVLGAVSVDDTSYRGSPYVAAAIADAAAALGYLSAGPATPSATPTATPTSFAICEVLSATLSASCGAPDVYDYRLSYVNITCPFSSTLTVQLQVAPVAAGPWTTFDQATFAYTFIPYGGPLTGSFTAPGIPSSNTVYRVHMTGLPAPVYSATTTPAPLCLAATATPAGATTTPRPTTTTGATPSATTTAPPGASPSPSVTATPVATCAVRFSDVPPADPFYAPVRCLACAGVISGYADGSFRPANPVTRGQVAKIVAAAAGMTEPIPAGRQTFADVPPSQPFWAPIERLAGRAVLSGYACGDPGEPCDSGRRPYFRPYNSVTRAQLAKIAGLAAGLHGAPAGQIFEDVAPAHPFYLWVEQAAQAGVISGYTCGAPPAGPCAPGARPYFLPYNAVTRGQTAKIVSNTFGCSAP